MQARWRTFRRFLTAEEVPRWFGLSIVLIYLVGLGSVAHYGIVQARQEGVVQFQRGSHHAVRLLAERLAAVPGRDTSDARLSTAYQRALLEFGQNIPARWLRVVDRHNVVIASTNAAEVGANVGAADGAQVLPRQKDVAFVPVPGHRAPDLLVRVPFTLNRDGTVAKGESGALAVAAPNAEPAALPSSEETDPVLFLEVRLPAHPSAVSGSADQAWMFTVVLVVLGALFVVYRCLREQLRGMSRVADRLQSHRGGFEEKLASLHIADTMDNVTTAWNELVDLTQGLFEMVKKSEAAEELSRALQRSGGGALAEALNAVPDGIVYIRDEGRFEYMNAAAARFFGWQSLEAKPTTVAEARADGIGARVLDLIRDALRPDGIFETRHEVLTADDSDNKDSGSYRVRVLPVRQTRQQPQCVVLIRDVSQQIRADRAREDFIAQVSHELRTPLTNIRAYAETLSSGMFDDPKLITECYNVITKETRRLSRLIEDILSVSQLEVGSIELSISDVDLKALLSDGLRDVRGLADEKNIDLRLVLPSKMEPVNGDRDKLAVVVNNLLGNAIKYTPPDGNVVVGTQFTAGEAIITVKDNGIGIDPAEQPRVFDKFYRAGRPEVQSESGTGIGLYTAREIVRNHGGEIELISEAGQGSTFMVHLPHEASRAAALTTAQGA